jgi:hypothetical protein
MACGDDAPNPPPSDQPAGKVTSIEGSVSATRPRAEPVALALDTVIYGDDTVTTERDASVTIRLAHNGAELKLAAEQQRRVDQSTAWTASGKVTAGLLDTAKRDRTSVAGRHSEREAGEVDGAAVETQPDPGDDVVKPLKPDPVSFDAGDVRRRITRIIQGCREGITGVKTVEATATIGTDGRIAKLTVSVDPDAARPIATCVEQRLAQASFGAPTEPVSVQVKVAFRGK